MTGRCDPAGEEVRRTWAHSVFYAVWAWGVEVRLGSASAGVLVSDEFGAGA